MSRVNEFVKNSRPHFSISGTALFQTSQNVRFGIIVDVFVGNFLTRPQDFPDTLEKSVMGNG